jgi:hypothetical protein
MFLDSRREDRRFWTEWQQAFPEFNLILISSWDKYWFLTVVPKYLNCVTFLKHLLAIFMSWFCPAFLWRESNIYLVFSVFSSRPTSLPASIKVCVLFLWYLYHRPVDSRYQHRSTDDTYPLKILYYKRRIHPAQIIVHDIATLTIRDEIVTH